nr:hypothetical protein [Tanacetum cinerariifolium]
MLPYTQHTLVVYEKPNVPWWCGDGGDGDDVDGGCTMVELVAAEERRPRWVVVFGWLVLWWQRWLVMDGVVMTGWLWWWHRYGDASDVVRSIVKMVVAEASPESGQKKGEASKQLEGGVCVLGA